MKGVEDLFSCGDLTEFSKSVRHILPINSASSSRFYICDYRGVRFLTKLSFYRKTAPEIYGDHAEDVVPHTDAEINILRILKDKLIEPGYTPCILEMVYAKSCDGLAKLTPRNKFCEHIILGKDPTDLISDLDQLFCRYADLVKNGLAHDRCAFIVLDRCDMTLDEFLSNSINISVMEVLFKSILFQILYTVYVISKIYPGFRHYDLHTDNIMLKFDRSYKYRALSPQFIVFTVNNKRHYVPYFGIIAKIIDFGFSVLPEEGVVSNIVQDKLQMYFRAQNDLLFLFHWIYRLANETDKGPFINRLLNRLEPNDSYVHYYTEYIRKIESKIPTYLEMLENKVWNEYRDADPPESQIYREYRGC